MSLRPPRTAAVPPARQNPASALDYEIAQEMAAALGRLGRGLERALADLAAFDDAHTRHANQHEHRAALVAAASHALWCFIVQREACGLRDNRSLLRDYGVPPEVRDRMGAFPPGAAAQLRPAARTHKPNRVP